MLLNLDWLREFVPYEGTAKDLGDCLTMLGFELEDIIRPYDFVQKIIVGKVVHCEEHNESEKLSVCSVDIGQESLLQIVCGAPNVKQGQKVPVAPIGTIMPNGLVIKKSKLRGVESFGMICSEAELGFSTTSSGIMVLPDSAGVGFSFADAFSLNTEVLKLAVLPNRGDCLSVLGFAREVALAYNLPLKIPKIVCREEIGTYEQHNWVTHIDSAEHCLDYKLGCIENVVVKQSPLHIKLKLHSIGIRSVSNVVDCTNYILMELGQPLHAFDIDKLDGKELRVATSNREEQVECLDGKIYDVKAEDLLVFDSSKPVALAGIMGCKNSEVTEFTNNICIECAVFSSSQIRKTSRRLGLCTESSYRFERGIDHAGIDFALERTLNLVQSLAGGRISYNTSINKENLDTRKVISFSIPKAEAILGVSIPKPECLETFKGLGCEVESDKSGLSVKIPSWRNDLHEQVDLIEEIIRIVGLDTIHEKLPIVSSSLNDFTMGTSLFDFSGKVKNWARGVGLNEVKQYSFISDKDLDILGLSNDTRVTLRNPLSDDQNVLRPSLIPSFLNTVRHNIAHGSQGLRIFEIAHVFKHSNTSETSVEELLSLGIAMHGNLFDTGWPQQNITAAYLDLVGIIEHLMEYLGIDSVIKKTVDTYSFLKPGVEISIQGKVVGYMGRISRAIAERCHTQKDIWVAEIMLDMLWKLHEGKELLVKPLPIYQGTYRDITFVVDESKYVSEIYQYLKCIDNKYLDQVVLLDMFTPDFSNEQNVTFRLYFRHPQKTFKDVEVDVEEGNIVANTIEKFGVKIQK